MIQRFRIYRAKATNIGIFQNEMKVCVFSEVRLAKYGVKG